MGAGHAHPLYRAGDSPVHRLPPQVKIAAAFAARAVRRGDAARGVLGVRRVPAGDPGRGVVGRADPGGWIASRALIELPFVVFAVLLPFVGHGERVDVLGVRLSVAGLLGRRGTSWPRARSACSPR